MWLSEGILSRCFATKIITDVNYKNLTFAKIFLNFILTLLENCFLKISLLYYLQHAKKTIKKIAFFIQNKDICM